MDLIARLRAEGRSTPALVLSALGSLDDRVRGLRAGGDELRAMLGRDIHRDRFLAPFTAGGRLIDGNVAQLPDGAFAGSGSFVAPVRPTELPGKTDVARLVLCAMPDGATLLTGVDLDDAEEALRVVERSLLIGLVPGVLLALGFRLIAGRRAARQVDAVRPPDRADRRRRSRPAPAGQHQSR